MLLLRKWAAAVRARLIDDAGRWWKMWSIWLAGLASLVTGVIVASPDVLLRTLNDLPPEMRTWLSPGISIGVFILVTLVRLWKQGGKHDG